MLKTHLVKHTNIGNNKLLKAGAVAVTATAASLIATKNDERNSKSSMLNVMQNSPSTLASRAFVYKSTQKRDDETFEEYLERMKGEKEVLLPDFDDFEMPDMYSDMEDYRLIESDVEFKESLNKFKNPRIRKVVRHLYNNDELYTSTVKLLLEINENSSLIKDNRMRAFINKVYDEILAIEVDDETAFDISAKLNELDTMINAYNNINGKYVSYKKLEYQNDSGLMYLPSSTQEFLQFLDSDDGNNALRGMFETQFYKDENLNNRYVVDFMTAQKLENFQNLGRSDAKDYLYDVYLKTLNISDEAKLRCKIIKEIFNVMVIPQEKSKCLNSQLDFILNEFYAWKDAGGDEIRLSGILNLNAINTSFLDGTIGICKPMSDEIQLKEGSLELLQTALRHELMHLNDKLAFKFYIGHELVDYIKEIMPTKIVNGQEVRDFDNCKYREEFLKAGLLPEQIPYAYKQRAEFIAVAAEGDMSKYSPEFKEVLIKLGMPEYAFEMKVINKSVVRNVAIMEKVVKEHPEVKDYDELVKLFKEEKSAKLKGAEALLKAVFGELDDDEF